MRISTCLGLSIYLFLVEIENTCSSGGSNKQLKRPRRYRLAQQVVVNFRSKFVWIVDTPTRCYHEIDRPLSVLSPGSLSGILPVQ